LPILSLMLFPQPLLVQFLGLCTRRSGDKTIPVERLQGGDQQDTSSAQAKHLAPLHYAHPTRTPHIFIQHYLLACWPGRATCWLLPSSSSSCFGPSCMHLPWNACHCPVLYGLLEICDAVYSAHMRSCCVADARCCAKGILWAFDAVKPTCICRCAVGCSLCKWQSAEHTGQSTCNWLIVLLASLHCAYSIICKGL
jgi:hypothetical protein